VNATPPSFPSDRVRHDWRFPWPDPPLRIVLVEPEIPPNTGNIARLCAATGTRLHLVEPLGFQLTSTAMKRAGLDYWDHVQLERHPDWPGFLESVRPPRVHLFTTAATRSVFDAQFRSGDSLVFGSESRGLPESLLAAYPDCTVGIPQQTHAVRSLNLANSAAIALYEALRQIQHANGAAWS
jgi:tRNA (cytidine/uridine-2'-O-)-methyltransferase